VDIDPLRWLLFLCTKCEALQSRLVHFLRSSCLVYGEVLRNVMECFLDMISLSCFCSLLRALVVRVPGYRFRCPGFDSRHNRIFWEVVGLERGPLSLVNTTEELFGSKSRGSGLENREYGRRNPLCWPRNTLYPQKLTLTSPTSGGRSVGILRSRTQATGFN
jgi:hypothetical protein